jgi:protein O-mannosyl-transferase
MSRKKPNIPAVPSAAKENSQLSAVPPLVRHLLALFSILAAGALAYGNSFTVPFVLDDISSIVGNPLVRDFSFQFKSRIIGDLSFALNYWLHGLDLAGYHAVNLLIHLLNGLLVYAVVLTTVRTPRFNSLHVHASAVCLAGTAAALLFVLHPLQTQAVTYLAQRVTALATLFYLLSVLAYARGRLAGGANKRLGWFLGSGVAAVLAMLSKEIAFTLPLALALYEFSFFVAPLRQRITALAGIGVSILVVPVSLILSRGLTGDVLGDLGRLTAETSVISRGEYFLTQFRVVATYLRLVFIPAGQNLDYDFPISRSLVEPVTLGSALLIGSLFCAVIWLWLRARRMTADTGTFSRERLLIAFGGGWFFLALAVESSIIPITDVIFEHRMYLPMAGIAFLLAGLVVLLARRVTGAGRQVLLGVGLVLSLLLLVATWQRNRVWSSEISLWEDVVAKSPAKVRARGSLGLAYKSAGRIEEALRQFEETVHLKPNDAVSRNNYGTILLDLKRYPVAVEQFQSAMKLGSRNTKVPYNLGIALAQLKRFPEAESAYRQALALNAAYDPAWNNLGIALFQQGKMKEAVAAFREAVRLNAGNDGARANLERVEQLLSR